MSPSSQSFIILAFSLGWSNFGVWSLVVFLALNRLLVIFTGEVVTTTESHSLSSRMTTFLATVEEATRRIERILSIPEFLGSSETIE